MTKRPTRIEFQRTAWGIYIGVAWVVVQGPLVAFRILHGPDSAIVRVLGAALMVLGHAVVAAAFIQNRRTYVSDAGVHRPWLFGCGEKFIAWGDIDRLSSRGTHDLQLWSGKRYIALNLLTFKDREELGRVIDRRVEGARSKWI
jgi:hypothetical protein